MPILQKKNYSVHQQIGVWHILESIDDLINLLKIKGFDVNNLLETKNELRLKQWLAVRLLLLEFYPNETIHYNKFGKPFLVNGVEISVSHANEYAAITLNTEKKCGIDIEKISAKVEKIKHKFLNEKELALANSLEKLTAFWCAKEALYKLYGEKELIFNEQLLLEPLNESLIKGTIKHGDKAEEHNLVVEKIDDFLLVYTI